MAGRGKFFDLEEPLRAISAPSEPLTRLLKLLTFGKILDVPLSGVAPKRFGCRKDDEKNSTFHRYSDKLCPRARCLAVALACAGIALILSPNLATADDVEPKVAPDRIGDVPATRPDPFPAFSNFGWRAFIALNWPALTGAADRGRPDRSKRLSDSGPRVWETFKSRYELFQRDRDGRALIPSEWTSYEGKNPCGPGIDNRTKTLSSFSEFSDFNQATFNLGQLGNPLVAQNRTYTRYEVRINREEFNSIVDHKWYIRRNLPTEQKPGRFNVGSIGVKAAWRILTNQDTPAIRQRYYVVKDAAVLDVAKSVRAGKAVCAKHDIALVGLHIVVKTTYRPQWLWSSFEHVDNVPPMGTGEAREPDANDAHVPYAYNDPSKPQDLAPSPGSLLVKPVSSKNPPEHDPNAMQVIRQHPINAKIMEMNRAYWALPEIRNTVWANYMLVTTQWPTVTQPDEPSNSGQPFPGGFVDPKHPQPIDVYQLPANNTGPPPNLANTTMETYLQDQSSSCMACHHFVSNAYGRDFVAFMAFDANDSPH